MTDVGPTDWTDDRLAEAFRARADARATPGDLVAATIDRVRPVERAPRHRRLAYLGGLVAAATVAALAILLVARPTTDRTGDDGPAQGLPILTVSEAIAVRDAGLDDREIAVSGFLGAGPVFFCAFNPAPPNPTELRCSHSWLMERPESLLTVGVGESVASGRNPSGPALSPSFALVDAPPGNRMQRDGNSIPTAVVLIGHFDDRRAAMCSAESLGSCRDTFIVDRVDSVEGVRIPPAPNVRIDLELREGGSPRTLAWAPEDVSRKLRAAFPNLAILSEVAISADRVGDLEPSLWSGALGIAERPVIVWLVTGLDRTDGDAAPVRRTFLIVDGTAEAYEDVPRDVSNIGFVPFTLIGTPTASEEPSSSPHASSGPSAEAFPNEVLGLPVIDVANAIERRDKETDDTELAVRGFWYQMPIVTSCTPQLRPPPPVRPYCNERFLKLTGEPNPVLDPPPDGSFAMPSDRQSIQPLVREGVNWGRPQADLLTGDPVVLVGHFHDRRAVSCPESSRPECSAAFMVDAVLDPSDPNLGPTVADDEELPVTATPEDIRYVVGFMVSQDSPLLLLAYPVAGGALEAIEPQVSQAPELKVARVVWVVRYLDLMSNPRPRVHTLLVIDGPRNALLFSIYEPTPDGLTRMTVIID